MLDFEISAARSAAPVTASIMAIIATHLADLLTFGLAVSAYGIAGEANPIVRELFAAGGLAMVAAVKVAGALAAALIVAHQRRWLVLAAGSGLVGATTTLVALA